MKLSDQVQEFLDNSTLGATLMRENETEAINPEYKKWIITAQERMALNVTIATLKDCDL